MIQQAKLEDSNMANDGSEEHKTLRKHAAQREKAWQGAGQKCGLQIWRIKKFRVKHWPKDRYGEFYSGDSYIILHTKENEEEKKKYDVFLWLGSETSQDEAGAAAYKTVELNDLLGDEPVQYREVQGNESKGFLDIFPKITTLEGGADSGFRKVGPKEYKPRLLHVYGHKKRVQVYQVPIKVESLNNRDCFVLDAGLKIFQFNCPKSSVWGKRKSNAIIDELQASRHGKVKDIYIIDGLQDKGDPLNEEFWGYFGGQPKEIPEEEEEEEMREPPISEPSMHHISDASGVMEIKEVARGKLDKNKLISDDAFVIDVGVCVYVWIGKDANKKEKREAMAYATRYLKDQGRESNIPIARVMEGKEPAAFHQVLSGNAQGGRAVQTKKWK